MFLLVFKFDSGFKSLLARAAEIDEVASQFEEWLEVALGASADALLNDVEGFSGDFLRKGAEGLILARGIAMRATADKVAFVVATALAVRLNVVEREAFFAAHCLKGPPAICTAQTITEVDCKPLLLRNPIHALVRVSVAGEFLRAGVLLFGGGGFHFRLGVKGFSFVDKGILPNFGSMSTDFLQVLIFFRFSAIIAVFRGFPVVFGWLMG